MARNVRLAAANNYPDPADCPASIDRAVQRMVEFWRESIRPILQEKPDLLVMPELCDRWRNHDAQQRQAFFAAQGDRMERMLCDRATETGCHIAYPTFEHKADTIYNTIAFIAPGRGVIGRYRKCVPTPGEHRRGVQPGRDPQIVQTSMGRLGGVVCFDLNFDPLLEAYRQADPEVLVFPSMYHGGHKRQAWAYGCRSYFVGAIANLPSYILSPLGEVLAESSNYRQYVLADVNLDYAVLHLDENWDKLARVRERYGRAVKLHDPGYLGAVMLTAEAEDLSIRDVIREYEIELLDSYLDRSWQAREAAVAPIEPEPVQSQQSPEKLKKMTNAMKEQA